MLVGVAVTSHASAIVSLERSRDAALCAAIERPGADLAALAARLGAIHDSLTARDRVVIDAGAGLGGALWKLLAEPIHDGGYLAERAQGRARQTIIDSLIAAVSGRSLTFAPGLEEEGAMRHALGTFRREVGEDGVLGSELVTALAVGLHVPFRVPPRVW
jgi:hypothetical protein